MTDNEAMLLETDRRGAALLRHSRHAGWLYATAAALLVALALLSPFLVPVSWNVAITRALQSVRAPGLQSFMQAVSGFGNVPKFVFVAALVLLALDRRGEAVWLTWSGLGGWLLSLQLKELVAYPRPTADVVAVFHQWDNASFPSGHVVFYVCFFGFLFFVARGRLSRGSLRRSFVLWALALPVALVGLARVYLGEHWPGDLPGSYILGGLWLALSLKLYSRFNFAREDAPAGATPTA